MYQKYYKLAFFLLLLFPFILFLILSNKSLVLTWDGYIYLELAKNIKAGHGFTLGKLPHLYHSPLFPYLIAFFSYFTGFDIIISSTLLCTICFSTVIAMIFYFCTHVLRSKSIGLWAILIFVLSERIQKYSISNLSENILTPLYTASIMLAIYLLVKPKARNQSTLLCISFLMAAAYYCKPEAIVVYFAIILGLLLGFYNKRFSFSRIFFTLAPAILVFIALLTPYLYYIYTNTHEIQLSGKSKPVLMWTYWKQNHLLAPEEFNKTFFDVETVENGFQKAVFCKPPAYRFYPLEFIKNLYFPVEFIFKFFGPFITVLLIYQISKQKYTHSPVLYIPLIVFVFINIFVMMLYSYPRFILPFTPFLAIYAGYAVKLLLTKCAARNVKILVIILTLLSSYPFAWVFNEEFTDSFILKNKSDLTLVNSANKIIIVTNNLLISHLNGMPNTILLAGNKKDYVNLYHYMKKTGAEYAVIDTQKIDKMDYHNNQLTAGLPLSVVKMLPSNDTGEVIWILRRSLQENGIE